MRRNAQPTAFASPAGAQASREDLQPQKRRRKNQKSLLPRITQERERQAVARRPGPAKKLA